MTMNRWPALLAALICLTWNGAAHSATPQVNYMMACQGCHLADGSGTPGKVPALKGKIAKFLHVDGGRAFLVQVPGTSQSALSNAETADVLNWILTTMDPEHLPQPFIPFTEEEVTELRKHRPSDISRVRDQLVASFPDFADNQDQTSTSHEDN